MGRVRDEESGEYIESAELEVWLKAVEELGSAGTSQVHEEVVDRLGDDAPTRRTTHTKLQELERRGEITSKMINDSLMWRVSPDSRREVVYKTVKEKGPATAEALSEGTNLTAEEFKDVLYTLEDEDRVESELVGDKMVWMSNG